MTNTISEFNEFRSRMNEVFAVGLVIGGSIVIPHLRRAMARLQELGGTAEGAE